ncbi:hypothetical protein B0H17DRAFT_1098864 [Mycena rosella]|uniref:Zn(2)-C6 fungal-type domain-containing protein n=1 Tax=Mycena rosella TaxID=1033263 RepID=A0AAD7G4X0_MYCRO|nr:hypothetical protein B0H17DRAFT_1098864 [Mycena rosella]
MSHPIPPDQTLASLAIRSRVYIACVHCRKRKIKCITAAEAPDRPCERCVRKNIHCEYMSVNQHNALYPAHPSGREGAPPPPPRPAVPDSYMPNSSAQSPPTYRGHNVPGEPFPQVSITHSNLSHYNPANGVLSRSQPFSPTDHLHDPLSRPRYPATVQHPGYAPAASRYPRPPQQYPSQGQGYHVDYSDLFPDPGLNNYNTSSNSRPCICPPGPCYCGGVR